MFRVAPQKVRRLALDEGSRTSAVLAQILLHELYGVRPELTPLPLGSGPEESTADAVLVIGDRAISSPEKGFVEIWDLGDRWCRWAELPFVFAMWVARANVITDEAEKALSAARDAGCLSLKEIAAEQAVAMQLPEPLVEEYLCNNLYYQLGPEQRQGLEFFYRKAAKLGLIQNIPQVTVDDCPIEHS